MENQEQKPPVEVVIAAADAIKLDLESGDTLVIVIKSDDQTPELLNHLQTHLTQMFPGNRVLLFGMGANDSMEFAVIKKKAEELDENSSCNTGNYCADCSCGKKEQYEAK